MAVAHSFFFFFLSSVSFSVLSTFSCSFTAGESRLHHHALTHRSAEPAYTAVVRRYGPFFGAKTLVGEIADKNILVISTAHDFNWIKSVPCDLCYNTTDTIYNPGDSKSNVELNCRGDQYCSSLPEKKCNEKEKCQYTFRYLQRLITPAGSYVIGILCQEKLRLFTPKGKIAVKKFTFGCTHKTNIGNFWEDVYGIMGLGRGPLSLVSQIGHEIFSFCLPIRVVNNGWLNFRPAANEPDYGDVTIPLVDHKNDNSTLYKVSIYSISIIGTEDERIIFMTKPHGVGQAVKQGIEFVIATDTPLSYIEDYWMQSLLAEVKLNTPFPTVFHSQYDICFNISTTPLMKVPQLPWMKLKFAGDATVYLNPSNLFVRVDSSVTCFTFATIHRIDREEGFILGSEALKSRKIVIDRRKNEVTFGPLLEIC